MPFDSQIAQDLKAKKIEERDHLRSKPTPVPFSDPGYGAYVTAKETWKTQSTTLRGEVNSLGIQRMSELSYWQTIAGAYCQDLMARKIKTDTRIQFPTIEMAPASSTIFSCVCHRSTKMWA